ncbi:FAD-binding protein [Halopseudomonas sp. Lyrl_26]|uniref:electron transfer flavoprotein subunit alpha/FixB family protein n=1 Tax=Halopseudomonas sp. Lyrl_26 TaxID=3110923 RepID=UPI003F81A058
MSEHRIIAVIPLAWGQDALLATLGAAQRVSAEAGCEHEVILLGDSAESDLVPGAGFSSATRVQLLVHGQLADGENPLALASAAAQALAGQGAQSVLLVPPGAEGEELAAQLAAQLDATLLGRCTQLSWEDDGWVAERSVWGGRRTLSLRLNAALGVACLRLGKADSGGGQLAPEVVELGGSLPLPLELEQTRSEQRLAPVQGAGLVVSGGRGLNEQGFALLEEIAARLDAALAGSLPAVDAGMVPVARQVGISGHFVSADIYLAVGISGTPQHLAGISNETCILAVNKDPAADIFKVANVGVVAEWEQLLPALLEQLPG